MPAVKVASEIFSLLVAEARRIDITVKDLVDMIVLEYFSEETEEEEPEEEAAEEEEEEE